MHIAPWLLGAMSTMAALQLLTGGSAFGFHPKAPKGSRCEANACASCSVPAPTGNGSTIPVGAPTGAGKSLTLKLDGLPLPDINECLCTCSTGADGNTSCTVGKDTTR
jgi:hypothetical protein